MLNAKLVVVGGDAKAAEVRLRLPCVIGRGREATLTLPHPLVSRRHCEIQEQAGRLIVRDLGSLNGTYVNNKRIEQLEPLEPDQLLTLGNVTFRAIYEPVEQEAVVQAVPDTELQEATVDANAEVPSESSSVVGDKETVHNDNSSSDTDRNLPVIEKSVEPDTKSQQLRENENGADSPPLEDVSSDIFVAVDEPDPADRSVSISSIEQLPGSTPAVTSFVGKVDFGDQASAESVESHVQIELGAEDDRPRDDDSGLDSFINKLPR